MPLILEGDICPESRNTEFRNGTESADKVNTPWKQGFLGKCPLRFCPGGTILLLKQYKLILRKKKCSFKLIVCSLMQVLYLALQSNNRQGTHPYHRSTALTRVKRLDRKLKVLDKIRRRESQNNSYIVH